MVWLRFSSLVQYRAPVAQLVEHRSSRCSGLPLHKSKTSGLAAVLRDHS